MQFYLDPRREAEVFSLPSGEVFWAEEGEFTDPESGEKWGEGFYWWVCFPGCMPENEPTGPFKTEQEAIDNAREMHGD